jgi:uncharacterized protein (TIGR03437 family)
MRSSGPILALLCLLHGEAVLAQQTTLNMSHDLVPLGIAAQNLTPNTPTLDARPLIQAAVQYTQSHPVQTLTLDQGAYYLLTPQVSYAVLLFSNISNLTVDLAGSTIYFQGPILSEGFVLTECSNFTLTNFTTDFINPPYTHVQLTSVDTANRFLQYQTLAGWPDPSSFNGLVSPIFGAIANWAAVFRNGSIVPGTTRMLLMGPIAGNTLALTQDETPWTQSATLSTLRPGDTVVVTARGGGAPFTVAGGDSITLSNITIYGSPTWAVDFGYTTNSVADGVRVMPRPGSGLIGSNADGIHFSSVRQNNIIRNCYVSRTMDDALIMDNLDPATVVSQDSPTQLTVFRNDNLRFPNQTAVNFVDPNTTTEFAGATIVAQDPPDSVSPPDGQVVLTFDQALPSITAGMGMAYASPSMRGQGSIIEDNLVEDTYGGRGIWIPGVEGVTVQRNVLRRTSLAGIIMHQETDAAIDPDDLGPPAHDVTITDNALEGSLGPAAPGTGLSDALAAITVVSTNNQYFGFASTASNSNISILNNYIADSGLSGIWAGELNGGTIQNNLVIRYSQNSMLGGLFGVPPQFQSEVAQDSLLPIVINSSSTGVADLSNTTSVTSPITAPVTMNPPYAAALSVAGSGSFAVQTAVPNFAWMAVSNSTWLTITSGASGAGTGTVQYAVAANASEVQRTGYITIAGEVFTVIQTTQSVLANPVLGITKTHAGNFAQGQQGVAYTATVANQAGAIPTNGMVTVTETAPAGLTLAAMSGPGWNCSGTSCARGDSLAAGTSYPPITVLANVASNAASQLTNQVSVSGGGSPSASASDPTTVGAAPSGAPVITPGGIGPAFSSSTTIQPGSWVSIYGSNLASTTATWNGDFPTTLGGVTVTIDGKNAYLCYVSPTQINLQAPDDPTTGAVSVTVTNANGSWTATVTLGPVSPSFSLLDVRHVAGIILRSDGSGAYGGGSYDIIGPTGTSLGYQTVAAKAGDSIELFGVGFGPTSPSVPAGQAFSGAAATTNPVQLQIGTITVIPSFAGLSSAGLDQINLMIPAGLGTGDEALVATVSGLQTQPGVVISLQ